MIGRADSVAEISVFPTWISVSGLEILPYERFSPVIWIKAGDEFWCSRIRMASSWIIHLMSDPEGNS